jgi:hypothetical protein
MWKKAFFRLLIVIAIVAAGMLYVAGADQKENTENLECAGSGERRCEKEERSLGGDFSIWESFSRMVSIAI